MKKLLLSILATVGMAIVMPLSASAATSGVSDVAGTITNAGNPVAGASVSVTCGSTTLTSPTTVAGAYFVQFSSTDCPAGSTAHVTATKGGSSGSSSGTVNNLVSEPTVINLAIVNVSVPEFGIVAGTGAALVGGAAFMIVRRQQLNQN